MIKRIESDFYMNDGGGFLSTYNSGQVSSDVNMIVSRLDDIPNNIKSFAGNITIKYDYSVFRRLWDVRFEIERGFERLTGAVNWSVRLKLYD